MDVKQMTKEMFSAIIDNMTEDQLISALEKLIQKEQEFFITKIRKEIEKKMLADRENYFSNFHKKENKETDKIVVFKTKELMIDIGYVFSYEAHRISDEKEAYKVAVSFYDNHIESLKKETPDFEIMSINEYKERYRNKQIPNINEVVSW